MSSIFNKLVVSSITDIKLQQKIDRYAGVYMITKYADGCGSSIYIAGHYYKALGKYIKNMKKGSIFTYNGCKYKVINKITGERSIIEGTANFNIEGQMYLQTCYTKDGKRIYFITAQNETS